MRRLLYHFSQVLLTLFWGVCILIFIAAFAGMGFAGGMLIGCWDDVRDIKFDDLEYTAIETWQQHLEVYSSVCEVQTTDKIAFLLDKLERLEYEKVSEIIPRLSQPGEYAEALKAGKEKGKENGTVRIHLRDPDMWDVAYPNLDVEAGHVQISVKDGKIVSIRNEDNVARHNFYLQPEKIEDIADKDKGTTRRLIPLLQMPQRLQGAFIAIEDRRFYEHWGVDIIRLGGAFKGRILEGKRLAGTSTLTQQLARNIYLFEQRSKRDYVRKAREILLAVRIEKVFSKDEILERYLNHVDLGRSRFGGKTLHGVQQAARGYFDKAVSELKNHECALLAALPKGPAAFSPFYNPKDAKNRRDIVLGQMLRQDYIAGESEWLAAINAPLLPQSLPGSGMEATSKEAGHFLQYVHEELRQLPELKGKLYSGGLKVITTIDMSMQSVAEKAVAEHLRYMDERWGGRHLPNYDENKRTYYTNKRNPNGVDPIDGYLQAALIAFEPKTGHIKAMVGGRDFYIGDGQFNFYNRAVGSAIRQPGSAFKPIVFAALLEEPAIVTPATVIVDEEWGIVPFPGQWWAPGNYTKGRFKGRVNVRDILTSSINVPTARAVWETPIGENGIRAGINRTVDLAKRMGIKSRLDPKPALSLGASDVTVLELTSAYGIFANGGYRTKPKHIQYILDATGEVIYPPDNYQVERTPVLDEKVAYQITSCLENVINDGTGIRAVNMGLTRPAAGKTGTTNGYVDAWFVGYTTDLIVGVWVGFDRKDPRRRNYNQQGAHAALPIWARFMIDAARGPEKEFPVPDGIVFREIDKKSGLIKRAGACPEENISTEPFIEGQEPKKLCNLHR
ncbi:MAG: transglycosylase domain-containing protein [Candidatus Poribacteria bacterium]|nr:transglycosylase domain-containing protein [Candidatus Poribacteria bacterium]